MPRWRSIRGVPDPADREILRQSAGERPDAGVAPVLPGSIARIWISSTSPGSAPSTAIGPVRMWAPSRGSSPRWIARWSGRISKSPLRGSTSRPAGDALHRHRVARRDGQHRLQPGIEKPPMAISGWPATSWCCDIAGSPFLRRYGAVISGHNWSGPASATRRPSSAAQKPSWPNSSRHDHSRHVR